MSSESTPIYTPDFYEQHLSGSFSSAKTILSRLLEFSRISSIVDVGCGRGTWLCAARELGIGERLGFDGGYVEASGLLVDPAEFRAADLGVRLQVDRRFDVAISMEVAEHLPFERAPGFVSDLVSLSDVVLFSAAAPYQGGADHVNEQWPEFWAILFRQQGFRCFDLFRDAVWSDRSVEPWYAQNVLLFVRDGNEIVARLAPYSADDRALSRVHPELVFHNATRSRPYALAALDEEVNDWHALVEAFGSGSSVIPALSTVESRGVREGGFPHSRTEYRSTVDVALERRELERRLEGLSSKVAEVESRAADEANRWAHERSKLVGNFAEVLARELVQRAAEPAPVAPAPAATTTEIVTRPAEREWKKRLVEAAPKKISRAFRRMRVGADVRYLRESGQFDVEYYLRMNADVLASGFDPIEHYVEFGVREGRRPRADFDALSIGRLQPNEFPRNPFVIHLQRQAKRTLASAERAVDFVSAPKEGAITRSADPVRYGARELDASACFRGSGVLAVDLVREGAQTASIIERFVGEDGDGNLRSLLAQCGPCEPLSELLATRVPLAPEASGTATYSLVTPFYRHDDYFRECARSVARLVAHDFATTRDRRVEWIIVNDDPRRSAADLCAMLPPEVLPYARILADGANRGIAQRLNEGIDAARHDWLLFLDCDDLIESRALDVLDHYSGSFPRCRYISGAMIDIDPFGREMRRRDRKVPGVRLFEAGMVLGHLVAVRRDLFDAIGKFEPRFSGCQDFEFALRAAMLEPLLQIPEHLYSYRWHGGSQSVSQAARQHRVAEAIRRSTTLRVVAERWPEPSASVVPAMPEAPRGICLVRTQGARLELLEEAVASITSQSVAMTACVIVHGDDDTFAAVQRFLVRVGAEAVVLHAPDVKRRRGHPLNVALEYVESHAGRFDFFCFLDDDDIYHPTFGERLCTALDFSGADVAYGTTNARGRDGRVVAMHPPLPAACLAIGNFIPNNAYVVRVDALTRSHFRFRDDIDYLEDWDFLLSLLEAGCRFRALDETLSEFRLIGDGNTTTRRDPEHFSRCSSLIRARGLLVANQMGPGAYFRSLCDFDPHCRPALTKQEREMLCEAGRAYGAIRTNRRS